MLLNNNSIISPMSLIQSLISVMNSIMIFLYKDKSLKTKKMKKYFSSVP